MSETLETVKVEDERAPGGYFLLNKSDFDPTIHKAYEPPASEIETDGAPDQGSEPTKTKGRPKKTEE